MKRHSEQEIGAKLRQAQHLLARGQSQAEACRELGVSVMTYHRWRKQYPAEQDHDAARTDSGVAVARMPDRDDNSRRIEEVRAENARLRRIVTDLLLEKAKTEEQLAAVLRDTRLRRN